MDCVILFRKVAVVYKKQWRSCQVAFSATALPARSLGYCCLFTMTWTLFFKFLAVPTVQSRALTGTCFALLYYNKLIWVLLCFHVVFILFSCCFRVVFMFFHVVLMLFSCCSHVAFMLFSFCLCFFSSDASDLESSSYDSGVASSSSKLPFALRHWCLQIILPLSPIVSGHQCRLVTLCDYERKQAHFNYHSHVFRHMQAKAITTFEFSITAVSVCSLVFIYLRHAVLE